MRAVCLGGGTGVPASIAALRLLGICPDTVVSVADDGGSSGLLRRHTGLVPPGDLRKCLVALAGNQAAPWVQAFKQRFNYASNHTLGNLVLTALQETTGSLTQSIALCEELLATCGHVYPASLDSLTLLGTTRNGQSLVGQSVICKSQTALARVGIEPGNPEANEEACRSIIEANLLVFGPGSVFTSIIPNVLIPGIRRALRLSAATTVFVCSVADVQGETWGLDAAELTEALLAHGLEGRLDYVLINRLEDTPPDGNVTGYFSTISEERGTPLPPPPSALQSVRPVTMNEDIEARIRALGVKVLQRSLADAAHPTWHSPKALAAAFKAILAGEMR